MSNTPTPDPVNPAERVLGAIPSGGVSVSFTTGLPADYASPTGQLPYLQKDPKTGKITSRFYDIKNDPRVLLNNLNETERKKILTGLATKISGYEPGTGFEDKDYSAFGDLLVYANLAGKPYFQAYNEFMQRVPNSSYVKKAPSVRVTSADDLKVVFRKASTDLLGYEVDDATAQSFAQSYRQMEIAEGRKQASGGVYEAAAAASTVAEQQILQQFKPEAQSFAAGNYAQIMDARIKELGGVMAAKDDFEILKDAVKNGLQSVTLPDGRTFTLEQARIERDRLEKELKKKETVTETEETIKAQQIKDAEKIVKNRENNLTQTLRAFGKNNASATDVANAQEALRTSSEFLSRLTSQTVVTATSTAAKTGYTTNQVANLLSSTPVVPPTKVVAGEPPAPTTGGNGVKKTVVITKAQVDAKLAELKLPDTPENRKTARQALKAGTTAAPAAEDRSWEPLFKQNYPQYNWMFTDLDRTKYADVFDLFKSAIQTKLTNEEFDRRYIGTSFYRELATSKKGRELSAAIGTFSWGSGQLTKFLTKAMQFGYEGENLKQQAYKELFAKVDNKYVNDLAVKEVRASSPYLALKRIGTQYLTALNDQTVEDALAGGKTADDLLRTSRELAKAMYPHLKDSIDAGVTLEDLAANYKQIAARTLELDPSQVDMGLKFNEALNYTKDGSPRMLSISEWETELRTNDKYKYSFTKQANQDATSIGLAIARAFGKVQ